MAHGAQSTHDRLDILDACPYGLVEDPTVLIHDHRRPPVVQQPHRSEHKGPHEDASHPFLRSIQSRTMWKRPHVLPPVRHTCVP